MTVQMFPINTAKLTEAHQPVRRYSSITHQLVLLSVVLNVCTLIVVANLSRVLLTALQQ